MNEVSQGELIIDGIGYRLYRVYEGDHYLVRIQRGASDDGSWSWMIFDGRCQRAKSSEVPEPVKRFANKMASHFDRLGATV